jgi:branched-chain amino acid transport system ATP-binding protein
MLELRDVHAYYGKSHVLRGVSLHVGRHEIVSVLGRNGVGRSTLAKAVMGLVERSGHITFAGRALHELPTHQIARAGVGYVPEQRDIFPTLTVEENLSLGRQRTRAGRGAADRRAADRRAVDRQAADRQAADRAPAGRAAASHTPAVHTPAVHTPAVHTPTTGWTYGDMYALFPPLRERQHALAGVLSGGEQQMLALARTMMGDPQLVIIDEPTEGLAPKLIDQVREFLLALKKRGTAVLLIEQKLTIALAVAQRVYVMGHGQVVFEGTPDQLRANDAVRREWLEV